MGSNTITTLILGSGPAGYTAAIYAARANLQPVLYQGPQPGGQLTITNDVENFPGYPEGINGPEMMLEFAKQATRFGTEIHNGLATAVDFNTYPFKVTIDNQKIISAKSIIISTGASAKWLGLESEKRLNGKGVSACAVCDGFFYKGQEVAVIGGGDSATEEAVYLANMCSKVHLIVRRNVLRASDIMAKKTLENPNITIHWNSQVKEILGESEVEGIKIFNNKANEESVISLNGVFVSIGHAPNTGIFKNILELDENGYIITQPNSTRTSIEGVFAAGDVQDHVYRQAVTAAGTGCMAAIDAERWLKETAS